MESKFQSSIISNSSAWFSIKKLTFIPHLSYLKEKCSKALKFLHVIDHTDWVEGLQTLLKLCRTLIHSKINYGCFLYGSARKSYQKSLNTIQNEGLRLILDAFRTSLLESLYTEVHEPLLQIRFQKLGLQYYTKIKSLPTHLAHNCIFKPKPHPQFKQKEKAIKPFGFHTKPTLKEAEISLANIHNTIQLNWLLKKPEIIFDLTKLIKKNTYPLIYQEKLQHPRKLH